MNNSTNINKTLFSSLDANIDTIYNSRLVDITVACIMIITTLVTI